MPYHRTVGWRTCLVGVLLVACGCASDDDFECTRDQECINNNIAGVCQSNNYCSFPDPMCDSGQRYAEHAPSGFAEECVPPEVAGSESGGMTTEPATTGAVEIDDSCVEVELGGELGMVDTRNLSQEDDDLSPSCDEGDGNDVVYLFTAPLDGEYRFHARGQLSNVTVSLWASCSGSELDCGESTFDPFSSTVLRTLDQGEPVVVVVDGEEDGEFQLEIVLVP